MANIHIYDEANKCNGDYPQMNTSQLNRPRFEQIDRTETPSEINLPDELWLTLLEAPCTFPPGMFEVVMLNLIRNPNLTSSFLFRADIFYDSRKDPAYHADEPVPEDGLVKHIKPEFKPRPFSLPGWQVDRVIVRQLVPRNMQLDKPLAQTCHFLSKTTKTGIEENLVVYTPHVDSVDEMPFYHPSVKQLAFGYRWQTTPRKASDPPPGSMTLSYNLFPSTEMSSKMERTGLRLLQTAHKHGQGQLAGYEKRVNLDGIIPQKQYQDTYAQLKAKYGKRLSDSWVEVTDPGKHVFEDIGIAAFLIELWRGMYATPSQEGSDAVPGADKEVNSLSDTQNAGAKPPFPGFVDIGCGNGILVYILISEGYHGSGFDARRRKTWSIFPPEIQQQLEQRLLVPEVLQNNIGSETRPDSTGWHNGIFPEGTFIVSNHADELTCWTPLLAYLNKSSFIAIPCCSHDLAGARFRAPPTTKARKEASIAAKDSISSPRLPQQQQQNGTTTPVKNDDDTLANALVDGKGNDLRLTQAAETGSLKRTLVQKKMASAYSTLCSYVLSVAETVGFEPEKDVLRIPSTRNQSIIGRRRRLDGEETRERRAKVVVVLEEELGKDIEAVGMEWVERAQKLAKKPDSGH